MIWSLTAAGKLRSLSPAGTGEATEENIRDLSISGDGTIWAVTYTPLATEQEAGGGAAVKYKKKGGKKWKPFNVGGAVKIDGGPSGTKAFMVNNKGEVWQLDVGKAPKQLAGENFAREISAGADGTVWVVSNLPVHGGGLIQYLGADGHWVKVPGETGGSKVCGTSKGTALVVNIDGMVGELGKDGGFEQKTGNGFAREISVSPDGAIWVISNDPDESGGNKVAFQPAKGGAWQDVAGGAVVVDAGYA